jgi:16S rRNA (guanine966-N2)-methyltransferase
VRVIGGSAKGRAIRTSGGYALRPTGDRVRECLYDILGERVREATMLDLFAGSGAVGIEALSRGAQAVTFVDRAGAACRLIRENLRRCGFLPHARILKLDFRKAIEALHRWGEAFDLVFVDPPYDTELPWQALRHMRFYPILAETAMVVLELATRQELRFPLRGFELQSRRRYGDTQLVFCTPGPAARTTARPRSGRETSEAEDDLETDPAPDAPPAGEAGGGE